MCWPDFDTFFCRHAYSLFFGAIGLLALAMLGPWIWAVRGLGRSGLRGRIASVTLQLSIVAAIVPSLLLAPHVGLVFFFFPLLWVAAIAARLLAYPLFAATILPVSLGAGLIAYLLALRRPSTASWALGAALFTAFFGGFVAGEVFSQRAMCLQASRLGLAEFKRNTFFWSFFNAPDEWQFEIHATGMVGPNRFGWSHGEVTWYVMPPNVGGEVKQPVFDCSFWVRANNSGK